MEVLIAVITGGAAAGVFKIIDTVVQWKLGRKGKQVDCITSLQEGLRVMLLDRILYLGRAYVHDKEVDADDRRRLNAMHEVYHNLGGNGDATALMAAVNALSIK